MYQAHQTDWLGAGFLVCVGLAVVLAALAQFKRLKLRNYTFFVLIAGAVLMIMTKSWLRVSDNAQLRLELKEINPLFVSNVVVQGNGGSRAIASTNQIAVLFKQLQRVQAVPAHHSHPTDSFEMKFERDGRGYRYRLGRDSVRTDEYWMFETARAGPEGREIGRVQSTELGPMLDQLLTGKP